jgi:hypothetical protein
MYMKRVERVDYSLLRTLLGTHSKTPIEFLLLECGVLKLRHTVMQRRLMYHYHLVTRDDEETIKKVYLKQKESHIKGDWYRTLQKDFAFIEQEMNDEQIKQYSICQYKKMIKTKVENAAFKMYQEKKGHKMEELKYDALNKQEYLMNPKFGKDEIKVMSLLRSKCHPAKKNFRKMYKQNPMCTFQCNTLETQTHILEECKPIRAKVKSTQQIKLQNIYGTVEEQTEIIETIMEIENARKEIIKN